MKKEERSSNYSIELRHAQREVVAEITNVTRELKERTKLMRRRLKLITAMRQLDALRNDFDLIQLAESVRDETLGKLRLLIDHN